MKFTFYGHACFSITTSTHTFLFDPFISPNSLASHIDIDAIHADVILVSHGHEDHVADLPRIAKNTKALVISNPEVLSWLNKQGYENVHSMNFGSKKFDFGTVHFVPAQHSSSLPDGSYGGNPGGFIIETNEGNVYYSGDTSLSMEMSLIPRYANIDTAILPIGGNFTMNASQAVVANEFIKANKVIGVHFDTFGYIAIDKSETISLFENNNIDFVLPEIGVPYEI